MGFVTKSVLTTYQHCSAALAQCQGLLFSMLPLRQVGLGCTKCRGNAAGTAGPKWPKGHFTHTPHNNKIWGGGDFSAQRLARHWSIFLGDLFPFPSFIKLSLLTHKFSYFCSFYSFPGPTGGREQAGSQQRTMWCLPAGLVNQPQAYRRI